MKTKFTKILAVDLETTGVNNHKDRIVEIACILRDLSGNELERFHEYVNPGIPIPDGAAEVHGISNEDVADKPPFAAFASKVQNLCSDAYLLAYNKTFDVTMLHFELQRAGEPGIAVDHPTIDPLQIERFVNGHELSQTYERYMGEPLEDAHSAMADIEATLKVYDRQLALHHEKLPATVEGITFDELRLLRGKNDKIWLDHNHKLYKLVEDETPRFNFGNHQDEPLANHISYCEWMLKADFPADTKEFLLNFLKQQYKAVPN